MSTGQFQPDTGQFAPGREKTGGRQRGTPNKTTLELRRLQEELEDRESDEMPLDYMLRVMRDPVVDPARRDDGSERRSLLPSPVASDRAQAGR